MTAIRDERIRRGLTAQQAAEKAGVAYKTWLRIEAGQPVQQRSWSAVDRLFGLTPGTALLTFVRGGDLADAINDASINAAAEERATNDSGRRYGIDQVMAAINAETIPDLIDHASRRLRQALAVVSKAHREEVAELTAENAQMRAALDRLRDWCDQCEEDEVHLGAVPEVRSILLGGAVQVEELTADETAEAEARWAQTVRFAAEDGAL